MKILMLGGTYFIGLSIVRRLQGRGHITMVNRGSRSIDIPGINLIKCDRRNTEELAKALIEDYDIVVDVSAYEPSDIHSVLTCLKKPPQKYFYISSAAVYNREGSAPPFDENASGGGDSIWGDYGALKYECEQILGEHMPSQLFILRPPYVYGPHNYLEREQFIWARLLHQKSVFVPGDGQTRVQFCYVEDIASFIEHLIFRSDVAPGAYNIGENRYYSFQEYIELLAEVSQTTPIIRYVNDPKVSARTYFPFRNDDLTLNVNKIIRIPGYSTTTFLDGIRQTYEWFNAHGSIFYTPTEQEKAWY
ncbi:NAD-dependent epimerase/dehydratase family protein [Paenibacillus wynnii]|uniref:NAD-dependent epimerase/dehydratase family protein n=1 Tax=Paenibacillus wynnii TaxID=268407 RepID=UPI0027938051|nr:NAD-dependent epimerase/dehydratase family protein [Paenibacillus wynnii]MDQ0193842.1 nucleoside-diphosphate-sugar epimerase [Paenibacillus wynnii]